MLSAGQALRRVALPAHFLPIRSGSWRVCGSPARTCTYRAGPLPRLAFPSAGAQSAPASFHRRRHPKGCGYLGDERRGRAGREGEVHEGRASRIRSWEALPHPLGEVDTRNPASQSVPSPETSGSLRHCGEAEGWTGDLPTPWRFSLSQDCATHAAPAHLQPRGVGVSAPSRAGFGKRAGEERGLLRCRLPGCPFTESAHQLVQMRPGSFAFHANEQIP